MPQVINTNVPSLTSQRALNTSQNALQVSLQRLSTGLRINSAKDDAAGLAISQRMTSQINGLNQAARNANDGISLSQTAEGALSSVGDNLQRIRELSVQSANATNSLNDRNSLQSEVKQLIAEIDRVANQTSFNGTKLLDGSFANQLFQVGADNGQTIGINSIVDVNANALGTAKFALATTSTVALAVDAVPGTGATTIGSVAGSTINGVVTDTVAIAIGDSAAVISANVVNSINAKMDQTGVYASTDSTTGFLTLTSTKADKNLTFAAGTQTGGGGITVAFTGITAGLASAGAVVHIADIDISTFVGAQKAMEIVDKSLTTVNSGRADLGAIQNRFSSAISNLQATSENVSAARSRIQDADFASETANLTRNSILQQAGTAMLAQANALPQNVLTLLRG